MSLRGDPGKYPNVANDNTRIAAHTRICPIFSGELFRDIDNIAPGNPLRRFKINQQLLAPIINFKLQDEGFGTAQNLRFGFDPVTMTIDVIDPSIIGIGFAMYATIGRSNPRVFSYTELFEQLRQIPEAKEVVRVFENSGVKEGLKSFVSAFVKTVKLDEHQPGFPSPHALLHCVYVGPSADNTWTKLEPGLLGNLSLDTVRAYEKYQQWFYKDFGNRPISSYASGFKSATKPGFENQVGCPIKVDGRYQRAKQ